MELPWYAEIKREQGAFATLLGLGVRAPTGKRRGGWRAVAVGDSCLMHIREGRCLLSFPVQKSADFNNEPRLISSRDGDARPERGLGSWKAGDRLLLMTDALAQWFLQTHEAGGDPWEPVALALAADDPQAAFADWIAELREREELRNDDVTLLEIGASSMSEE
jgi:hypothetical protein